MSPLDDMVPPKRVGTASRFSTEILTVFDCFKASGTQHRLINRQIPTSEIVCFWFPCPLGSTRRWWHNDSPLTQSTYLPHDEEKCDG